MALRKWTWPLLVVLTALVLIGIVTVQNWGIGCIALIALTLLGVRQDQRDIPWKKFLPLGFLALFFPYAMYNYAGSFWQMVADWQTQNISHLFQWNDLFNSIPFNDGSFFWFYQPQWLTRFFGWIYWYGFTLSFWACMIRSFFTKDAKKMLHYALAGFVLQTPLILPFYNTVLLQEVWFVKGLPDMLDPVYRHLVGNDILVWVQNCFPSMHTSMSFAMILMARREKSRWFRNLMTAYCAAIIFSTLYLKIHWVIDVLAGMLFAYGVVKLGDLLMHLVFDRLAGRRKRLPLVHGEAQAQMAATDAFEHGKRP